MITNCKIWDAQISKMTNLAFNFHTEASKNGKPLFVGLRVQIENQ